MVLGGETNVTDPESVAARFIHGEAEGKYLHTLSEYMDKPAEVSRRLRDYYSFMFVREPMERLLSAYNNKFVVPYNQYFKERFGRRIIKRYRKNPSALSLETGGDVRFDEFVKFITDTKVKNRFNEHWLPFHEQCRPCAVHYNAIGSYDNLNTDVQHVMKEAHIDNIVKFPDASRPGNKPSTKSLIQEAFVNITVEQVEKLMKIYEIDYEMFNYTHPIVHNNTGR